MATENLTAKLRTEQFKRDIRASFRCRAELYQAHQCAFHVERLNENLIGFLAGQEGLWAGYRAYGYEPRLDKVIQKSPHLQWVYPKMVDHQLVFVRSNKFTSGRFGIEEPVGDDIVPVSEIHGFLVPGISFDRRGVRLGRGKGFYDRALAKADGHRLGVCFSFQIFQGALPCESFDVKMDAVVSEQGAYHVSGI